MISDEIFKDLTQTLLVLLFFLEILKKKKKSSEKKKLSQLVIFRAFFLFISRPPPPPPPPPPLVQVCTVKCICIDILLKFVKSCLDYDDLDLILKVTSAL